MEDVLRYSIPVLHPVLVHFPIGFTLLAAAILFVWLIRDRLLWLTAGLSVQTLAFFGALAAYVTGEEMEEQSEGVPIVEELVHTHEDAALIATWLIGVSLLSLIGAFLYGRHDTSRPGSPVWMRSVLFLLSLAAAAVIAWTAHIGGVMVWGVL